MQKGKKKSIIKLERYLYYVHKSDEKIIEINIPSGKNRIL